MHDSGPYAHLSPDKTKVSLTLAKVFVLGGGLIVAAFTGGGIWADHQLKMRGVEARLDDLPTKTVVRQLVDELAGPEAIREVLRAARWRCAYVGRGRQTWVECQIVFGEERPK